jgi:hypothetical protein
MKNYTFVERGSMIKREQPYEDIPQIVDNFLKLERQDQREQAAASASPAE